MDFAKGYAEHLLRGQGNVPASLILRAPEGILIHPAVSLEDVREKDRWADLARIICVGTEASQAVLVFEGWGLTGREAKQHDPDEDISERHDRQEVLLVMGESHSEKATRWYPMIRMGNGKFFGLGEDVAKDLRQKEATGRFTRILPDKIAPPKIVALARLAMQLQGLEVRPLQCTK